MRGSVFKRIKLLRSYLKFNAQISLAYKGNFYAGLASTFFYTLVYILFINVIYSNTDSLVGYNQSEMTLFFLAGQLQFFIMASMMLGFDNLVSDIHTGKLDLVLTKPMPHLFYYYFGFVDIIRTMRLSILPLLLVLFVVDWNSVIISVGNTLIGIIFFILGQIVIFNLIYTGCFGAFFLKKAEQLIMLFKETSFSTNQIVPFDLLPSLLRGIVSYIIPLAYAVGIPAAILLDKINWVNYIIPLILSIIGTEILKQYLWNFSLKKYSSASS